MLLTEAEAARALRICARKLREARQAGTLHYVLIGRAVRYTPEDLAAFIDSLRQAEPQCPPQVQKRTTATVRRSGTIVPFHRRNPDGRL